MTSRLQLGASLLRGSSPELRCGTDRILDCKPRPSSLEEEGLHSWFGAGAEPAEAPKDYLALYSHFGQASEQMAIFPVF